MLPEGILHLVLVKAPGQGAFRFAFIDLPGHVLDNLGQLRRADGLEQILVHPQGNGLLGVFKIPIAADDDDLQPGHHGLGMADEFKAIQEGHADVGKHNIRHQVLHHRKGHFPVGGLAAEGKGPRHALDDVADALADEQFILHHKNLIHDWRPLCSFIKNNLPYPYYISFFQLGQYCKYVSF